MVNVTIAFARFLWGIRSVSYEQIYRYFVSSNYERKWLKEEHAISKMKHTHTLFSPFEIRRRERRRYSRYRKIYILLHTYIHTYKYENGEKSIFYTCQHFEQRTIQNEFSNKIQRKIALILINSKDTKQFF